VVTKEATKDYVSGTQTVNALRGVSLEVESGEFTSIAGPSGSGKTTLLNLIGCLDVPTSGKVVVAGRDISTKTKNELADLRRGSIGFIFQTFNLVPVLSAFENVEFPLTLLHSMTPEERRQRVEYLMELVGLTDMMHRRPDELSGGQQQRVAIARALVKKPKLVLADEPTANLDSKTGETVLEIMKKINQEEEATFIFSTHDRLVMDHAKRLIILKDGKITEDERR
jgi:putative ABC transport system ATP-binding protein